MWYMVLGLLTLVYLVINNVMPSGSDIEVYLIRPLLWILLAIITYVIANNEGLQILKFKKIRRWSLGQSPIHAGLLLGGFQVSLLIIVGIFTEFGKSPYSFAPIDLLRNAFFVVSLLVGMEVSRAYLIKKTTTISRKYTTIILVTFTFIYMFFYIEPGQFSALSSNNPASMLEFAGSVFVTALAVNLLASYLSYLGGATASMGYMGTLLVFQWFSPILPNPHWTILALIGTIAPAIGFVVLQGTLDPFIEKKRGHRTKKSSSGHGWTIIAVFSLIMVFFSYGFLGVEPTVIYSGSMQPTYEVGDIVIVDEVEIKSISEGDVIQFVRDNVTVLHRVVEISQSDTDTVFITKGDANKEPDFDPVASNQILGKAIYNIPKIGWIQIYVKEFFRAVISPIR